MNPAEQTKSQTNASGKRARKISFPKGRLVHDSARAEIRNLLAGKSKERQYLIEHLHLIQDKYNQLPVPLLASLAEAMKLSQSEVFEVATFYHHFAVVTEDHPARPPLTMASTPCCRATATPLVLPVACDDARFTALLRFGRVRSQSC